MTDKKTKQTRRVNGQEEKIEKQKRWISREDGKQEDKMAVRDVKNEGITGLSDRIREQRKKMGITQGEMAKRNGGGIRTVNYYERGTRQPSYGIDSQFFYLYIGYRNLIPCECKIHFRGIVFCN